MLSPALLWVCHQDGLEHMVSDGIQTRVRNAYNTIRGTNPQDYNPVEKVPLHIYQIENEIQIEESLPLEDGTGGATAAAAGLTVTAQGQQAVTQQQLNTLLLAQHRSDRRTRENFQQLQVSMLLLATD